MYATLCHTAQIAVDVGSVALGFLDQVLPPRSSTGDSTSGDNAHDALLKAEALPPEIFGAVA